MERTLTLETHALKAASRQWNRLSPEVQRMSSMRTLLVHRTAPLIKDLEFVLNTLYYWPGTLLCKGEDIALI